MQYYLGMPRRLHRYNGFVGSDAFNFGNCGLIAGKGRIGQGRAAVMVDRLSCMAWRVHAQTQSSMRDIFC